MPNVTPEALAHEFADIVKQELDAGGEFEEMLAANDADPDTSVCHSHDYIDANVSMLQAWCYLNGVEEKGFSLPNMDSPEGEAMFAVWNEAWNLARANRFYADAPNRLPHSTAYGDGYTAYLKGQTTDDNLHEHNTLACLDWDAGWYAARRENRDARLTAASKVLEEEDRRPAI